MEGEVQWMNDVGKGHMELKIMRQSLFSVIIGLAEW